MAVVARDLLGVQLAIGDQVAYAEGDDLITGFIQDAYDAGDYWQIEIANETDILVESIGVMWLRSITVVKLS